MCASLKVCSQKPIQETSDRLVSVLHAKNETNINEINKIANGLTITWFNLMCSAVYISWNMSVMELAGTFEIHNQIYWEGFLLMKI